MNTIAVGLLTLAVGLGAAGSSAVQDVLDAARQLYAAAAFDEALAALTRISEQRELTGDEGRQVDEYRIFTFFALGRVADAEAASEALIRRDPLTGLQSSDASPRIRALYDGVRARLLPQLIRDRYRAGRAAIDAKDFATADLQLAAAERLIDEADKAKIADGGLADLRVLVDGFRTLSRSPAVNGSAPVKAIAEAPALPPPSTPAKIVKSTYTIDDIGVVPPTPLYQVVPTAPPAIRERIAGIKRPLVLNLTIDETGRVRKTDVVLPVNPVYDQMVVNATSRWRYKPATKDGAPVAYIKALAVSTR
jgi:hypothetical protein